MVGENTSIISRTDIWESRGVWLLLEGQTSQHTRNRTAVQSPSPSTGQIGLPALGSVVHLELTGPTFPIPSCGFQAEMAHFKFILLTFSVLHNKHVFSQLSWLPPLATLQQFGVY